MEEEKPIYKFNGLKSLLISMGYQVDKASGYREVENTELDLNDIRSNIELTDEGIFFTNPNDGSKQQIFLYKKKYRLGTYGKPRFHIRKCQVIQAFINNGNFSEYRRANTSIVDVDDMDDNLKRKKVRDLPLCSYCAKLARDEYQSKITSSDFVEILKNARDCSEEEPENLEVDIFGYTKDWEQISTAYRESKNYTCERCGLQITNPFDKHYMHTHHRNGDKLNNKQSNLECLCLRCHSRVDFVHRQNFSKGANKILLDQFNQDYPEE